MSIKGFSINGEVQKYDYNALDNLPNVTGLSEEAKTALLACFQNVAWVNANGQTYYDALEAALSPATMYSITNNLTGCTTSNSATTIEEGSTYTATITASSGYTLDGATATATMGGQSVTGFYNNGTISIPNVTGNLVITVTATSAVTSISAVFTQGSAIIYSNSNLDTLRQYLVVTATYSDSTTTVVTDYTLSGTLEVGTSTITAGYGGKTDSFTVTVTEVADTTAEIATEGYVSNYTGGRYATTAKTYGGITIRYPVTATTKLYPAGVIPYANNTIANEVGNVTVFNNDVHVAHVNEKSSSSDNRWAKEVAASYTEYSQSWDVSSYTQIEFSVDVRYLDDAYMYDKTTGMVFFAGKNTPYYGMSNISEAVT